MSLGSAFEAYAESTIGPITTQFTLLCRGALPSEMYIYNQEAFSVLNRLYAEVGRQFKTLSPRLSLTDRCTIHSILKACAPRLSTQHPDRPLVDADALEKARDAVALTVSQKTPGGKRRKGSVHPLTPRQAGADGRRLESPSDDN